MSTIIGHDALVVKFLADLFFMNVYRLPGREPIEPEGWPPAPIEAMGMVWPNEPTPRPVRIWPFAAALWLVGILVLAAVALFG